MIRGWVVAKGTDNWIGGGIDRLEWLGVVWVSE